MGKKLCSHVWKRSFKKCDRINMGTRSQSISELNRKSKNSGKLQMGKKGEINYVYMSGK
jgi:hypothetical protein